MKSELKKRGVVFVICGIAIIVVMFIPFISVLQGPNGFLIFSGGEPAVVVCNTYSPMDFVYMLFSSEYSLSRHSLTSLYVFVGVLCVVVLCVAITLIVVGIIFMVRKNSTKQKQDGSAALKD